MLSNFSKLVGLFSIVFLSSVGLVFAQATSTPSLKLIPPSLNINPGQSATVQIESANVDVCVINGSPYNNFNVIKNGSILLRPTATTEYTVTCTTSGSPVSSKVKITIVPVNNSTGGGSSGGSGSGGSGQLGGIINTIGGLIASSTRTQGQYSNQTIQGTANDLCARYSNYASVYPPAVPGSGGGFVPVDFTNLASILLSVDRNTQLTANETRQENIFRYCTEYQNMARATSRISETAAQTIKNIADNCYADEKCLVSRVYKSQLEQEVRLASEHPVYGDVLPKLLVENNIDERAAKEVESIKKQKFCNDMYAKGFAPSECVLVPKAFDKILEEHYSSKDRIARATNAVTSDFRNNGEVIGNRRCLETRSGRAPEEVRFYEADCIHYRQEPSIINQEALRQITALPYTQAFSPSSVLGFDGVLDNINTRIREGNLIDPTISSSFGSIVDGDGVGLGTNLGSIEENYKKLATNIGVIVQLYDVAKLAYASSTSVCKDIPVQTRSEAISRIDSNKQTYVDYLIDIKKLLDAAMTKPKENHTPLIIKINFDLKDKYNQQEIDKVYEAVKKLLQLCVDAQTTN